MLPKMNHLPRFPLLAAMVAVIAVCLLLPGLSGGFVFDDKPNIVDNGALHITDLSVGTLINAATSFEPGHGTRQLAMLSFALDYWRAGLNPQAFKTTNLLIHLLTTLVLALFLRRLLLTQLPEQRARAGALILALLWAVHPLQVSSVLYVVQRMQTLVTLFMVLGLWAYMGMRQAQQIGQRSWRYGVVLAFCWLLGLASKEDAILLPAYTLALELTILRFGAASARTARRWQRGYLLAACAAVSAYAVIVLPHYWNWGAYPGRDFSSSERLLTQGRVLVSYLGQILLPLPGSMPFFYDDLAVSRSLWQPITTLPALLALAGLLGWGWHWRKRRPLFALGILLFFAGHAITSNVVNLELAFEHRNQLPMLGVLLAAADLCRLVWQRFRLKPALAVLPAGAILLLTGGLCAWRAHLWGNPIQFAQASVAASPLSPRAWMTLSGLYFERSESQPDSPWLTAAINVNQRGAALTGSAPMLSNVVIFKTIRGDVTPEDWSRFLSRLKQVPMSAPNKGIAMITLDNLDHGIALDERGVIQTLEIITQRTTFAPNEYLRIAAYLHNESHQPGKALPYLKRAVELSSANDAAINQLLQQLDEAGRADWVVQLNAIKRTSATGLP